MPTTESGFLVLADITGYTSYVAHVELEHADQILTDLLEAVVEPFQQLLTISKLEGDAVFANVPDARLPRPEALLELIENTYVQFRQRRDSSTRQTTCGCRACGTMGSLDLKFFLHHGEYVVQEIAGMRELAGSCVNLIHRLAKNHVTEATGWHSYVLFTDQALQRSGLTLDGLHEQTETYDHLGPVRTFSLDLHPRHDALMQDRRVIIPAHDADLTLTHEFASPPAVVWQLITDPRLLSEVSAGTTWTALARPGGRAGAGARNHCAHGKGESTLTFLDWRPFHYYTAEGVEGKQVHREMYLVEPLDDGARTRLTIRMKSSMPLPQFVKRMMMGPMLKKHFNEFFRSSEALLQQTAASAD